MISPDALILAALRAATSHLAPGDLAAQAGLSLPALAERISALHAAGFDIENRPALGWRLMAASNRLIADDLWARLALSDGGVPGKHPLVREILVFTETSSTNEVAARRGRHGSEGGLVVLAERQSAGRGRFGRRWESAQGCGIWMSLLLRPNAPLELWPRLTTAAAVAISSAIEQTAGVRTAIKWPNDILIDGRKVAGILIETGKDDRLRPFAVIGIGINVQHEKTDFPPEIRELAHSLRLATGAPVDRAAVVVAVIQELTRRLPEIDQGFDGILAEALRRSSLIGQWVRVQMNGAQREGIAESLDGDGRLLLREASGALLPLSAGEVTLRG